MPLNLLPFSLRPTPVSKIHTSTHTVPQKFIWQSWSLCLLWSIWQTSRPTKDSYFTLSLTYNTFSVFIACIFPQISKWYDVLWINPWSLLHFSFIWFILFSLNVMTLKSLLLYIMIPKFLSLPRLLSGALFRKLDPWCPYWDVQGLHQI